jgi:predicted GIY-YIG superfamily endonuclease
MRYVYLRQSETYVGQRYIGVTSDLRKRLADHQCREITTHVQIHSLEIDHLCCVRRWAKGREL